MLAEGIVPVKIKLKAIWKWLAGQGLAEYKEFSVFSS
jgi:hypothetical protein